MRSESAEHRGKVQLTSAIEERQVQMFRVQDRVLVEKLSGRLHHGELEVVVGAVEQGIPYVILDDRQARGLAATYRLNYTGTIGILMLAKSKGLIPRVKPHLDCLGKEGFRLSESLYQHVLKVVGED